MGSEKDPYRILPPHTAEELARLRESITAVGRLLDPVILDTSGNVIDGHARRDICEALGIDPYRNADVRSGLSEAEKKALAIRLNLARRTRAPTQAQRRLYVDILLQADPSLADTVVAQTVGLSQPTVNRRRQHLIQMNKLPKASATVGKDGKWRQVNHAVKRREPPILIVKNRKEYHRLAPVLAEVEHELTGLIRRPKRVEAAAKVKQNRAVLTTSTAPSTLPPAIRIECCDFRKLSLDESVDLILTDVDWSEIGCRSWPELARLAASWLKPRGVFASFIGQQHWRFLCEVLAAHFHERWHIAINFPSTSTGRSADFSIFSRWRPVVVFTKERGHRFDPPLLDKIDDLPDPEEVEYHAWQKRLSTTIELVKRLSVPGALVVDPMMGTGTCAVACAQTGRRFVGCDIDPEQVAIAKGRVATSGRCSDQCSKDGTSQDRVTHVKFG